MLQESGGEHAVPPLVNISLCDEDPSTSGVDFKPVSSAYSASVTTIVSANKKAQPTVDPDTKYAGEDITKEQRFDPKIQEIVTYLEQDVLPTDERRARRLALEQSCFNVVDGFLYFCDIHPPYRMRTAVPEQLRPILLAEAHSGRFSGHFAEKSMYGVLARRYWWDGMRADVHRKCRACLPCATRKGPGHQSHPPLKLVPVGGPVDRVGVDVLS